LPSVSSLDEASFALAAAHAEGRRLRIGEDLAAHGLDRVLEHDPGDLTCTVEAGVRLSELRDALAASGQRLSLDPPGDPTIGVLLARNLSGPLRHRFGAPRDLVLGATLVLYDSEAGETEKARELAEAILDACLDAGGSLTGEHGVGMDKACSMPRMFSERDLQVFERLRRSFDPAGLCNPGKVIPTPRLCGEVPGPYRVHALERIGVAERL